VFIYSDEFGGRKELEYVLAGINKLLFIIMDFDVTEC